MIRIEQNQAVPENPHLKVLSVSGDYADNDLIECAPLDNPDFALCAFSATFIRYGALAHQFSDPLKLGEALLAVDPESTHDAVTLFKEEEVRRIKREGGDFTPENPVPADESISQITQEEIKEEEKKEEEEKPVEEEPATTPEQPESTPETGGGSGSVPEIPTETVIPVEVPTTPTTPTVPTDTPAEVPPATEADISTQNTITGTIPERPVEVPEPVEPPSPLEALIESVSNAVTE